MVLPVAVAALGPKLPGGRHPPRRGAAREGAIELRGLDVERAVAVAEHHVVPEPADRLALHPDAGSEVRSKEFIGHHAIVAKPVRMRALQRARARIAVDAGID